MAAFNVGTIISTAVHEAYPGHYVQFLWMNRTVLSQGPQAGWGELRTLKAGRITANR